MFKAKSKCLETEDCPNNDTISEAFANVLWKTEKVILTVAYKYYCGLRVSDCYIRYEN